MDQIAGNTSPATISSEGAAAAEPLATARAEVSDLHERLRSTTTRLTRLRHGIRAEFTDLVHDGCLDPDDANGILRRLVVSPLRRAFHCHVDVPVTIDVTAVGDASALRQARHALTQTLAALAQISLRREPDCFGIDAPHTSDDDQAHRLVHTTLPLTVTVTATGPWSVWPAAKRRLVNQLSPLTGIRANLGAVNEVIVRDEHREEPDRIRLR